MIRYAKREAKMSIPAILKLDAGGLPVNWINWQTAVTLYARGRVCWEAGAERFVVHGGICARTGLQSKIEVGSIVAVADRSKRFERAAPQLTRDHVVPVSRGGGNGWENCVTACRDCNQKKDDRTPEEAGLKLLAVPYTPNLAEYLILQNRRILADQMEFLLAFARKHRRQQRRRAHHR